MKIGETRDLVNKDFVKRGLAQEYPFQLILDRFFTEQEKAENAKAYESLTPEECKRQMNVKKGPALGRLHVQDLG